MGYYTSYDFSSNSEDVISEIEKRSGYGDSYGGTYDCVKWYEHHEQLLEISREFPDNIILLEGIGEESGDIWKKYYKNGKHQEAVAKIVFEPFDESKLK